MKKFNPNWQNKKSQGLALLVSLLVLVVLVVFIVFLQGSQKQKENLETTQRYLTFEKRVKQLIHTNIVMLKGFDAFLRTTINIDEEKTYKYLDHLLADNFDMIRNIGLISDTTVFWNYPRATNTQVIGKNLALIADQKDIVMQVKNEKHIFIHGPFNLVQGGSGISIRYPILYNTGEYWGQASIVLKLEEFLKEIASYADELNLKMAIFGTEDDDDPFFNNLEGKKQFLEFKMDPSISNWTFKVGCGTKITSPLFLICALILVILLSIGTGIVFFQYLQTNYRILNISIHDHLTGLYNRHFLDEYQELTLATAKRESLQVGLIMFDLNKFKVINDTYGHKVGDLVLSEVGRLLREFTRSGEAAFRLGGDEFLLILPNIVNDQNLIAAKERFQAVFDTEFNLPGYSIKPKMSLGTALYPKDGTDFSSLLQIADHHLYREKQKSRQLDL